MTSVANCGGMKPGEAVGARRRRLGVGGIRFSIAVELPVSFNHWANEIAPAAGSPNERRRVSPEGIISPHR